MINRFTILALLLSAPAAMAQYFPIQGACNQGAVKVHVAGIPATDYTMGVVPSCAVTVYLTGTTNLAIIHSSATGGILSNPFQASNIGQWIFYADANQAYDVTTSSGVTLTGVYPTGSSAAGGGPSSQNFVGTNSAGIFQASPYTPVNRSGDTMTGALNTKTIDGVFTVPQWTNIAGALAQCPLGGPCWVNTPPTYTLSDPQPWGGVFGDPQTTGPKATDPTDAAFFDPRYGGPMWILNGTKAYDSRHAASPTLAFNFVGNSGLTGTSTHAGGGLNVFNNWWMGGRNFFNDKMNTSDMVLNRNHYTNIQDGGGFAIAVNGFGNGDALGRVVDIKAYGGSNTGGDQGAELEQAFVATASQVFSGTLATYSAASDGTTTLSVSSPVANGTQGEGRLMIDTTKVYNAGYISSFTNTTDATAVCSGCDWDGTFGTGTKTTLTNWVQNPVSGTNSFPQSNVNLAVASSAGFVVGDVIGIWDNDWECEKVTAIPDGTHITIATDRLPHYLGAYVTRGGLTCYAIEFEADRLTPTNTRGISTASNQGSGPQQTLRWVFPIMYSSSGNHAYLFTSANTLPGTSGQYAGAVYTAMGGSGGTCSVTVSGGQIASVTVSGGTGYISANDPPQLVLSGITYTTAPVISVSTVSGGALFSASINNAGAGITGTPGCTVVTSNPYDIYPMGHVRQVYNETTGAVDGSKFVTEPWSAAPSISDNIEEPLYFYQHVTGTSYDQIGQYFPTLGAASAGMYGGNCIGIQHGSDNCVAFVSTTDPALFSGYPIPRNTLGYAQYTAPLWGVIRGPARHYWDYYSPPLGSDANSLNGDGFQPAVNFTECGSLPCSSWVHWYWLTGGSTTGTNAAAGVRVNPSTASIDVTAPVSASLSETTDSCSLVVSAGQVTQPGCLPGTLESSAWFFSGQEDNYSAYSSNFSGATWFVQGSSGGMTLTLTPGQPDPFGTSGATQFAYTGCTSNCGYQWANAVPGGGTNLDTSTPYVACAIMKGTVGTEVVQLSISTDTTVIPVNQTLTTKWSTYCTKPTTPINGTRTFQIANHAGNETFLVDGICTTTQSTCLPSSIPTAATQHLTLDNVTWAPTLGHRTFSGETPLLTAVSTTALYSPTLLTESGTMSNIVAVATSFTCTVNPVFTLQDCGTSAACATPTALASVTLTAANTITEAAASGTFAPGNYTAWQMTAGTCTSLQVQATASY